MTRVDCYMRDVRAINVPLKISVVMNGGKSDITLVQDQTSVSSDVYHRAAEEALTARCTGPSGMVEGFKMS